MIVFIVLCVIVVETKAKAKSLSHSDVETTVSLHSRDMHFVINFVLHFVSNFVLHSVINQFPGAGFYALPRPPRSCVFAEALLQRTPLLPSSR